MSAAMLALLPLCALEAQTIDFQVVGACGNYSESPAGSLCWTLGEMRASESINNSYSLTDGFHQIITWHLVSTDEASNSEGFNVTVSAYPNPVIDLLRVESSSPVRVELFDLNSEIAIETVLINQTGYLDLSNLPAGNYFLQAQDNKGRPLKTLKIQRVK